MTVTAFCYIKDKAKKKHQHIRLQKIVMKMSPKMRH